MTTIQVRIDDRTKRASSKILEDLGLDVSSAVKVYLKQIIVTKGIPFPILTRNGFSVEEERSILQASAEAKRGKNVTKAMNVHEALAYLRKRK